MSNDLRLLTQIAAAKFIGIAVRTLRRWEKNPDAPPRRKIGKSYYYQRASLTRWLENPQDPTQSTRRSAYDRRPVASQSMLRD